MMKPLVSVIIPTYNRAYCIKRTIDSVLGQSYENFEVIIVDDGSSDNTNDVVLGIGDSRIIYHRFEQNKGIGAARNAGIKLAKGDYLYLLDSDDEIVPEALKTFIDIFLELPEDVGFVYADALVKPDGYLSGRLREDGYITLEQILSGPTHDSEMSVMMRKSVFNDRLFDEELTKRGCEITLLFKLTLEHKIYYINKPLRIYYRDEHNITAHHKMIERAPIMVQCFEFLIKNFHNEVSGTWLFRQWLLRAGFYNLVEGNRKKAKNHLLEAFKHGPRLSACKDVLPIVVLLFLPRQFTIKLLQSYKQIKIFFKIIRNRIVRPW